MFLCNIAKLTATFFYLFNGILNACHRRYSHETNQPYPPALEEEPLSSVSETLEIVQATFSTTAKTNPPRNERYQVVNGGSTEVVLQPRFRLQHIICLPRRVDGRHAACGRAFFPLGWTCRDVLVRVITHAVGRLTL